MLKIAIAAGVITIGGLAYYSGFDGMQALKTSVEPQHSQAISQSVEYTREELAEMTPNQLIQMQKDALTQQKKLLPVSVSLTALKVALISSHRRSG